VIDFVCVINSRFIRGIDFLMINPLISLRVLDLLCVQVFESLSPVEGLYFCRSVELNCFVALLGFIIDN
jgi:hypothetical protein